MAFYHKLGSLPPKKHITFYKQDKKSLFREELVSTKGFSGIYSTKYHINAPTKVLEITELEKVKLDNWDELPLQHIHFRTDLKKNEGDFFSSRNIFLHNQHCLISAAHPTKNADFFYKNAYSHEYIFVHHGKGLFVSDYGKFRFEEGDQIIVPMGTIYQLIFDDFTNNKLLIIQSDSAFEIPRHYRNEYGQLNEEAPYCERDFKLPEYFEPYDNNGRFKLIIKAGLRLFEYILPQHPYDVVGWDGYLYPFAFNIKDFSPKVAKLHLPPPVHLLFDTQHFVLCNFCPRLFDFHPEAIPVPYFHTNVESAEVLYYVEGDFMSRIGVGEGSVTLHPLGLPHGPQPGKIEESLGAKETFEFAVMIDTFDPLGATKNVKDTMDEKYYLSWLD